MELRCTTALKYVRKFHETIAKNMGESDIWTDARKTDASSFDSSKEWKSLKC